MSFEAGALMILREAGGWSHVVRRADRFAILDALSGLLPRRIFFISNELNHCSTANASDIWSIRFESPTEARSDFAQLGLKAA